MYNASLDKNVSIIPFKGKQIIYAVKLHRSYDNTLLINIYIYMPRDNHFVNNVNSEFPDVIDETDCLINVNSATRVILCGDWNWDFSRNTVE